MPKRFTATEKWDDAWFCHLPPIHKLIWMFLCDSCDAAGIWEVNKRLAEFKIAGQSDAAFPSTVDWATFLKLAENRIQVLHEGTHWRLTKFIGFQYPGGISSYNKAHSPIFVSLSKHGVSADYKTLHSASSQGAQDKDTVKVTEPDTEPDTVMEPETGAENGDDLVRQFYDLTYIAFDDPPPNRVEQTVWNNCTKLVRDGRSIEAYKLRTEWAKTTKSEFSPNKPQRMSDPSLWDQWGKMLKKEKNNGQHNRGTQSNRPTSALAAAPGKYAGVEHVVEGIKRPATGTG